MWTTLLKVLAQFLYWVNFLTDFVLFSFKYWIQNLYVNSSSSLVGTGGEYDGDRKIEDLKLLYRAYIANALSSGRMEDNKVNSHFIYAVFN